MIVKIAVAIVLAFIAISVLIGLFLLIFRGKPDVQNESPIGIEEDVPEQR